MDNVANSNDVPNKIFMLTSDDLAKFASLCAKEGGKEGIKAYQREREEREEYRRDEVRASAKYLIIHYRRLKKLKSTAVHSAETVQNPTLMEIFEEILDQVRESEFDVESIKKSKIKTGVILDHVDVQLENYRKECDESTNQDVQRRYRIVNMMYLQGDKLSADKIAEIENIDRSTVYRTLNRAFEDLAALFFGIDAMYKKCRATNVH